MDGINAMFQQLLTLPLMMVNLSTKSTPDLKVLSLAYLFPLSMIWGYRKDQDGITRRVVGQIWQWLL